MNRFKWASKILEPNLGDIVLIKEDDLPPNHWMLGPVLENHPCFDKVIRVSLYALNSMIKRPTNKLCILPITD